MNSRRQFMVKAPLGLLAASAATGTLSADDPKPTTPPAGAPPTFGALPPVGPEVSTNTFAEA